MLILSHTKLSILPINLKTTQTKTNHLRHMKNPSYSLAQKDLHMKSSNSLYHPPFFLPSFLHFTTTQPQDTYTQTLEATSQNYQRTDLPTNKTTNPHSHASQRLIPKLHHHHAVPVLPPGPLGHLTTPSNHPRKPHPPNDNNPSSHAHGLLR